MVRTLFASLAWFLVGVMALLLSVYGHLYTDLARELIRDHALEAVNRTLKGEIQVGRIAALGPNRIRLVDVSILDPQGREVVHADEAVVEPNLGAILGGTILLDSARARDGFVRLLETPEGELSIAQAFQPVEPSPDTGAPSPAVVVDDIRISGLDLSTSYAPVGLGGTALRGTVRVSPQGETSVRVREGDATILRQGDRVGRIAKLESDLEIAPGETSRLELVLESGEDRVSLRGTTVLQPEDEGAPAPRFDATIELDPLSPATLRRAGLGEVADQIGTSVRGTITAEGTPQDLSTTADLRTDGGPIRLDARLTGMRHLHATVKTEGLDLGALSPAAPAMRVGGEVEADVVPIDAAPREVTVSVRSATIGPYTIPSLHAEATIAEDHALIRSVRAPYLGGDLDVQGRVGFDGNVSLDVHARLPQLAREPNLRQMVPGIAGALRADARVRFQPSPRPRLFFDGEVTLRNGRVATVRADRLHLEGHLEGQPDRPEVNVRASGTNVIVSSVPLGDFTVAARGGPGTYDVNLRVDAPGDRRVRLDGRVRATERSYSVTADLFAIGIADHDWRGRIEDVTFVPDREVRVGQMVLASGQQRLEVDGTYGLGRNPKVDAKATLQHIDLALLDAIPEVQNVPVTGQVDVTATIQGDASMPDMVVEGAWSQGRVMEVPIETGVFFVRWQLDEGAVATDVQVTLGDGLGGLAVRGTGELKPGSTAAPVDALMEGHYELEVTAQELQPKLAEIVAPGTLPPVEGRLSASLLAAGTMAEFSLAGVVNARDMEAMGYGPMDVDVDATYEQGQARARVVLSDGKRELAQVWGNAEVDLPTLAQDPNGALAKLEASPWELHAQVPPVRLDELPGWLRSYVDLPARAALRAQVVREPARPTQADLEASLEWLDPVGEPVLGGRACASDASPKVTVKARIRDGEATADIGGFMHGRRVMRAEAEAPAPIDRWLEGRLPTGPPPVALRARVVEARLSRMPYACQYASGEVSAEVVGEGLFTDSPSLELTAHSAGLVAMDSPTMTFDLTASADSKQARMDLQLDGQQPGQGARVTGRLPIRWGGENMVPALNEEGRYHAELNLEMTPLGPLLAPVPGIGYASGMIDGTVIADGRGRDVRLDGQLELNDVSVSLLGSGNRLDDVRGRLLFEGQTIRLDGLHAHDQGGTARVDGRVVMAGLSPKRGRIDLHVDEFPVRKAGVIVARVSTKASIDMRFPEEMGKVRVRLAEMRVSLENLRPPQVQSLEPHEDVNIVGPGGRGYEEDQETAAADPYVFVIDINTVQPMWVRRQDMAAQLEVDLRVRIAEQARISGRVELIRGFFELAGKRFELEEGRIQFTGGTEVDPVVRLEATYDAGGGEELIVRVTGRVSDPQLSFSSSSGDVNTLGDALAILTGGGGGGATGQSLESQAASVLSGVTAGILTTTLRREIGDMFPVISVDATGGGGTLRAGLNADRIIPDFMDDVVQSAYVEGFVSTGGEAGRTYQPQGTDSRTGVMVEFRFVRDITGAVSFEPPQAWSVDVMWEP